METSHTSFGHPEPSIFMRDMLFCFCLFSFSLLFSRVEFMTAFNLEERKCLWHQCWPSMPLHLLFFFFLLILTKTDGIVVNSQLVLLKFPAESAMHGGGSNLDWNLKSVFFHFGLSSGCYCTMISPATVSAHRLRFLYDGVEKAGGMINGQENHRLNAFCHSHVLFSHHTCLFSCEFNRYYLALSFYKGGLAQKFLMDAKKME